MPQPRLITEAGDILLTEAGDSLTMEGPQLSKAAILESCVNVWTLQDTLVDARGAQNASLDTGSATYTAGPGGDLTRSIELSGSQCLNTSTTTANFERTDARSIGGWVYITDASFADLAYYWGKRQTSVNFNGHSVAYRPDQAAGRIVGADVSTGVEALTKNYDGVATPLTWQHIVYTHSGNDNSAARKLYVNGVLRTVSSETDTTPITTILNSEQFNIGGRSSTSSLYLPARFAEVFVADFEMTASQVAALYNGTAVPRHIRSPVRLPVNTIVTRSPVRT